MHPSKTQMTLNEATEILRSAGIASAREEARILFREVGKIPPHQLVFPEVECSCSELISAVKRRAEREPLQYILGEVGFFGERYTVTPDCLIPRPDTEILVEYAVKNLPRGAHFLDLCTGSGCVAISTLKHTDSTRADAYDISEGALRVAAQNAEKNGISDRLTLHKLDLMTEMPDVSRPFAVLSNPPYVTDSAYLALEPEIYSEPRAAFVGGADGADFYRRFVPLYKDIIDPAGFMAFEIGFDQAPLMLALAEENGLRAEIIKDLSGNDRVAVMRPR